MDLTFSPSSGDYATSLSLTLPPGLLLDLGLAGGACLNSAAPTSACALGTVTTIISFVIIAICLGAIASIQKRRASRVPAI